MPAAILLGVILVHVTLCSTIRVPVEWATESEVKFDQPFNNEERTDKIPSQYFEYTAKKPQFAIDVAAAHDVKFPEKHYTSYPIRPYTGVSKPNLGTHHMFDSEKESFYPYQRYVSKNDGFSSVTPAISSYEVYHPYKAEEPALQELYKDPVLEKIRNDLRDSKDRLQKYENDAGQPDITKDEYLESPEQIDYKHQPQKNKHLQFEIYRPMHRPVYYRPPPRYSYRENILNKKLRHPWNQNYAKVAPIHYRPIKNHIHNLRQHHALKFDDEQNEYPQLPIKESYVEKPDGYDIYEKGRDNYMKLRNNVDESINKAVLENRPYTDEKLELKLSNDNDDDDDESNNSDSREDEFIPIKNYAQVRKTETTHHLPRQAAFQDAESLEEIKNAPRLREAVKSTKAQIVYSEEGYEDSAYDHAGEQKHASDHEGHGGFLKEHELSGGKYKIPSSNAKYEDISGSAYGDKVVHGEKWKNNDQDSEDETDVEDYSENEQDNSEESEIQVDTSNLENSSESAVPTKKTRWLDKTTENQNPETLRNKRQESINNDTSSIDSSKHVLNKREFIIPEINIDTTYLTGNQISKLKITHEKENNTEKSLKSKYPYYYKNSYKINNDSPLRYAENLLLIPKKTKGGTEFYDSKKKIICPKVEEDIDPIPEKLKKGGNPDDNTKDSKDEEFAKLKNKQRLEGLGDKIDCLKAKYFGENPLDSPFFNEDLISSPEPITKPNVDIFNRNIKGETFQTTQSNSEKINYDLGLRSLLDQISKQNTLQQEKTFSDTPSVLGAGTENIQYNHHLLNLFNSKGQNNSLPSISISKNKRRKKRATPFTYEPYKIIRESQVQDSKKTTTTNNISPLIKQLQSSRVVDRVTANQNKDQVVKRNTNNTIKNYKDIGKVDRQKPHRNESDDFQETEFIDVSIDKRRGEPRYELQHRNHKNQYTPVNNKKAVSLDEYRDQTGLSVGEMKFNLPLRSESLSSISKVNFDVSKYLPSSVDPQNSAASNTVNNVILTSTIKPSEEESEEEEYEDYEEDEETQHNNDISTTSTTTTTTTQKPIRKRKPIRILMTAKPAVNIEKSNNNNHKLRLTTRFRNPQIGLEEKEDSNIRSNSDRNTMSNITPKLREKKKKVSQSTVVTDSKSYGDEDDDMRKEDIDALIGVKHDTDDYLPEYERQQNKKVTTDPNRDESEEDDEDNTSEEEDDDEGDSSHDEEDNEEGDEDDDEDENINESSNENATKARIRATTPEPTKRTLPKTTVATITTTETYLDEDEINPTVFTKNIEVHRELPVNKLSPNLTHFKQDIKEIEIIKMMPPIARQKTRKNLEAFDLYKDENLAKDINKLGGVEIFKESLDINSGPKHGGNYRSIEEKYLTKEPTKADVETSQSQTKKLIDSKDSTNSSRQVNRRRNNIKHGGRNSELTDISGATETTMKSLHGGNLKALNSRRGGHTINDAKIIELREKEDEPLQLHGGNLKARRGKHNVREQRRENQENSEIVRAPGNHKLNSEHNQKSINKDTDRSDNAAILLSSYARAVPVLTTAPPFILDPSKRRYYYVDD